jgi:prevent-host-death family protein
LYVTYVLYVKYMPDEMTMSVTDARTQLAELVNRVAYSGQQITLTRHGRPMAVLVSVADAEHARVASEQAAPATVTSLTAHPAQTTGQPARRLDIAARTTTPPSRSSLTAGSCGLSPDSTFTSNVAR